MQFRPIQVLIPCGVLSLAAAGCASVRAANNPRPASTPSASAPLAPAAAPSTGAVPGPATAGATDASPPAAATAATEASAAPAEPVEAASAPEATPSTTTAPTATGSAGGILASSPAPLVAFRAHGFVLWRPDLVQDGSILFVEIEAPVACDQAEGEWLDHHVKLFTGGARWRALLPVPLGADGVLPLVVRCGPRAARFDVPVHEGTYPESRLTVDPKFSRPPPPRALVEQKEINRAFASGSPDPLWTRDFALPITTRQTSPYGVRRTFNQKLASRHRGIDYAAAVGDPIRSANDGVVVLAGADYYFTGNTVFVDHGGGLFTVYFHMSKLEVKAGDHVERGQVLGLAGATGRVTGPHLHFGVKLLGQYVNPEDLLQLQVAPSEVAPAAAAAR